MRLINKTTKETLAEIVTNHSMSVDEAIDLMGWYITDDGEVFEYLGCIGYLDDIDTVY